MRTGLESSMNSVVAVDLVKGAAPAWPRLESDDDIMSSGSVRPLEDAFRISQKDLIAWTSELTGLNTLDALQLVSQMGLAPAANACDPSYTMVAKLPRRILHGARAYGGVHGRLRASAVDYLAGHTTGNRHIRPGAGIPSEPEFDPVRGSETDFRHNLRDTTTTRVSGVPAAVRV